MVAVLPLMHFHPSKQYKRIKRNAFSITKILNIFEQVQIDDEPRVRKASINSAELNTWLFDLITS